MSYSNKDYWYCECEHDYIHPKTENFCAKCGTYQDLQLDSITGEMTRYRIFKGRVTSSEYLMSIGL